MTADCRTHGHTSPEHNSGLGEDAKRGMTSNGPSASPPRAVVAHRSRESDTDREPNQDQQQRHQQYQEEGIGQGGQRRESRDRRDGRDSRDTRDGRDERHRRDDRDDRDHRGRNSRGRDSRNDRDSHRKSRKSGGNGGGNGNNHHNRPRRSRERSGSRGRHDRPSSLTGGEASESRPSTGPVKRPRSPSVPFGPSSAGGGATLGGSSQAKRSRLDKSPYRHSHDPRGGRTRSRTPPSYHPQQHSSSRLYSSRSPLPPSQSSSTRRERRSRNKNKSRNTAGAGATRGESESRRHSSTQQPTFPSNRRDTSGSPGRIGGGRGGDSVSHEGNNISQELPPSDTASRRDTTPDEHAPRRPPSSTRLSASPHSREIVRDKDRERDRRERDRGRERDRARGRGRDRERGRARGKDHEKERDRDYDRERDRNRDRDRAPRDRSPHSSKKKDRTKDFPRTSHSPDTAANADQPIDADMGARGARYRSGPGYSPYTSKGHVPSQQQQKQRQHPHSHSDHATPNTSFHGSPPSQHSPYGEPQGWPAGAQQYSPQTQHTPQQYPNNYPPTDAPKGPSSYPQASNSPPYDAPTGPGGQYSQYSSSGLAHGSIRGRQYGPGRGEHGGNRNDQWNAGQGPEGTYPLTSPLPGSPHQGNHEEQHPHHHGQQPPYYEGDDVFMQDPNGVPFNQAQNQYPQHTPGSEQPHPNDDSIRRPGWDHDIDRNREWQDSRPSNVDDQMPPPSRPPPTGPQSKFSFAFKATSKPTVTAPKAEIAQKLSSVVSRQPQQQQHQQSQDSPLPPSTPSHTGDLQLRPHSSEARHSFPRNAPTEPASSRARSELRQRNAPSGPSGAGGNGPRYRKVKQIIRRPKPRPTLSDDMAASESVYYRKPGNESVVGSGTYGQVFKAVHVYTKQLAALKKIRMDGEREGLPVTAIREIKLLQSLNHVNIVDLLEVMVEDGHCYMVFEYLSHDLNGLLNHPTFKLDAAQKKHMGLQMFQGLDYLHRRGVLHRDIKAANILVSSNGILKIADFGLARFFAKRHQLDYTNRVITIWYRSPELLLGETQYGPAVDIWSAACVLVEIFTRYPIFPGDGGEISQINKIYGLLGTPSKTDWPGLVDMPWFELLRPSHRLPNNFSNFYANKVSPAALSLLIDMFQYDPAKRPSAAQVLEHPYFAQEEPAPRQAIELASIGGDWHEFETKALRRENERKAKEAKEAKGDKDPKTATANPEQNPERNPERKKRPPPHSTDSAGGAGAITAAADDIKQPEAKRQHVERADGPHEQQVGDSKRTADPAGIVNGV